MPTELATSPIGQRVRRAHFEGGLAAGKSHHGRSSAKTRLARPVSMSANPRSGSIVLSEHHLERFRHPPRSVGP